MSAERDGLTVTEALALAGTNAGQLAGRLRHHDPVTTSGRIILGPSLWPTTHEPVRVGRLRWAWWVTDHATDRPLDLGYALTEAWARHRADAAARRIHADRWDKRKAAQAEADR